MAFQSGTATSLTDFFTQLRTFATTNSGFTNAGTSTINGNTVHKLTKGSVTWSFEETVNLPTSTPGSFAQYFARMRMTYTAPTTTFNETVPVGQKRFTAFSTYGNNGPFTGHNFYTEGNAVHAVLEVFPNVFQHLSFGNMTKLSTWAGGEYLTAGSYGNKSGSTGIYPFTTGRRQVAYSHLQGTGHPVGAGTGFNLDAYGFVRYVQTGTNEDDFAPLGSLSPATAIADFDSQSALMSAVELPTDNISSSGDRSLLAELIFDGPNAVNQRTALLPMYVMLRERNAVANPELYFIAGVVPIVRVVNIRGLSPNEQVNTDWRAFPTIQKTGDTTVAPVSVDVGFAYQEVP